MCIIIFCQIKCNRLIWIKPCSTISNDGENSNSNIIKGRFLAYLLLSRRDWCFINWTSCYILHKKFFIPNVPYYTKIIWMRNISKCFILTYYGDGENKKEHRLWCSNCCQNYNGTQSLHEPADNLRLHAPVNAQANCPLSVPPVNVIIQQKSVGALLPPIK